MARGRKDIDEDHEYSSHNKDFRRHRPWGYDDPYAGRSRSLGGEYGREDVSRGIAERLDYHYDELRYAGYLRMLSGGELQTNIESSYRLTSSDAE